MKPFDLIVARNSFEATAALARAGAGARLVAGGTDLLVELKSADRAPALIIDISRASDMKRIAMTEEGLAIGAVVTHSEILDSPLVAQHAPAVAAASRSIGAVQTRNLGTLGGNLVNCVPSLDGGPVLVALEAEVVLAGPKSRRQLALDKFFLGPRKTALQADELLLEILIPKKHLGKPVDFQKFGLRKGQALALVNVAASFRAGGVPAAFLEPRIALGAVAPTVMRARKTEAFLEGRTISPEAMREAGSIAAAECRPISDFRASAGYRRELVAVLTRRALEGVQARAGRN